VIAYLIRRFLQGVVVLFVVTIITFGLEKLLPGNPAIDLLGAKANPIQIEQIDRLLGLNRPVWVQYWNWLDGLLHGNLCFSYKREQSVNSLLVVAAPKTLVLVGESTIIAVLIAIPMGILQAVRRNTMVDYALTTVSFVLYATPVFFLGLVCLLIFSDDLNWFAPSAPSADGIGPYFTDWNAMFLPVITLALPSVASYSRYVRSSVLDQITQDYVRTAVAKGAKQRRVLYRHVLRNALMPMITLLGYALPALFSGALITEVVFNMPGLGLLYINSAEQQDYATMLGLTILITIATIVGSLVADLGYAAVDPRVRLTDS
jgi:peptide/nickel transport system permease protein